MGSPTEKGKIPHSEWGAIVARERAGESLASIARSYHCSAPAIRYIVRRQTGSALRGARKPASLAKTADPGIEASQSGPQQTQNARAVISSDVHRRITREISLFLVALDSAMARASTEAVTALYDATDRLMRATARLRIELDQQQAGS